MSNTVPSERGITLFLIVFVAAYVAMYAGYISIPDDILRDTVYPWGIVRPVVATINLLDGDAAVAGIASSLGSHSGSLEIVRGCDGSGVLFLLTAAILAVRALWRSKVVAIGCALVFVLLINHVRLVALYFVLAHANNWFVMVHVYVFPVLMLLLGGIFFLVWASRWGSRLEGRGDAA
jgi:exosortase family protein XrtM